MGLWAYSERVKFLRGSGLRQDVRFPAPQGPPSMLDAQPPFLSVHSFMRICFIIHAPLLLLNNWPGLTLTHLGTFFLAQALMLSTMHLLTHLCHGASRARSSPHPFSSFTHKVGVRSQQICFKVLSPLSPSTGVAMFLGSPLCFVFCRENIPSISSSTFESQPPKLPPLN